MRSGAAAGDMFSAIIEDGEVEAPKREPEPFTWRDYAISPGPLSQPAWQSPEDQRNAIIRILDALEECPCCGAALSRKEWEDGRFIAGPDYRGPHDSFRCRNDALSLKFKCGLFLAADQNVGLSAHLPCLTATSAAVQSLFDRALQKEGLAP